MRTPEPVVLAGEHLRLEPLEDAHVPDLLTAAQDDAIWSWMSVPRPRTEDDLRRVVAWHRDNPSGQAWAVLVDGRTQGSTSYLDVDVPLGGLEVGWTWYARALWSTSVNPECKLLLLEHAFHALGAERVSLKTDGRNLRSRSAIGRLGARYDGTLRHSRRRPDGTVRDTAHFSLLASEWPAARQGLLRRLDRA